MLRRLSEFPAESASLASVSFGQKGLISPPIQTELPLATLAAVVDGTISMHLLSATALRVRSQTRPLPLVVSRLT